MDNDKDRAGTTRRDIIKLMAAMPAAAALTLPAWAREPVPPVAEYKPTFFSPEQWRFIVAAADRLIPADDMGPSGSEAGAPVFLDRHMRSDYANGSIWYTEGPYDETMGSDFGYQGPLVLHQIITRGIDAVNAFTLRSRGKVFADLDGAAQDEVLKTVSAGKAKLDGIDGKIFFSYFWKEIQVGYFADPSWGGNRNQAGWKAISYPGMRADYDDWITVRDRPYSLPSVDLAGDRA